LIELKIFLD